jgi:zinc transport system substrate-binding protein
LTQTDALKQDFRTLENCPHKEVVHIGHLAFTALAAPYGLHLTALSGTAHEGEHSALKLAELTQLIKQSGVKTIFSEETLSGRLARAVAQETDTQILPLYSIEHISKADFVDGVTYDQLMRRNLDNLKRGLGCP